MQCKGSGAEAIVFDMCEPSDSAVAGAAVLPVADAGQKR